MAGLPTTTHWFMNSEVEVPVKNYAESFIFKPPASIAGKSCIMKVIAHPDFGWNYSYYMTGLSFPQNVCVDPTYANYANLDKDVFLRIVGNDDRSSLIATGVSVTRNPDIIVQVPPGPTEVTLGFFTGFNGTDVFRGHFIIEFTPID